MILDVREEKYPQTKYVVYAWDGETTSEFEPSPTTCSEEVYDEMNEWCRESFGSHTRTAYNVFEFKKYKYLQWFLVRWSAT